MPESSLNSLHFYPAYCFKLSPTFNVWNRLTVRDVHTLEARTGYEGQNIFYFLNHPLRWIRLVGLVVSFDVWPNRVVMVLDDSTGSTIEIFCKRELTAPSRNPAGKDSFVNLHKELKENKEIIGLTAQGNKVDLKGIDIGTIIKVKGSVGEFRQEKQVLLERVSIIHTTTDEVRAWSETADFYRDILSKSWLVSESDQRKAKLEATHAQHDKEARKERKRRKRQRKENLERELHTTRKHEGRHQQRNGERSKDQAALEAKTGPRLKDSRTAKAQGSKDRSNHAHRPMPSGQFDALGL